MTFTKVPVRTRTCLTFFKLKGFRVQGSTRPCFTVRREKEMKSMVFVHRQVDKLRCKKYKAHTKVPNFTVGTYHDFTTDPKGSWPSDTTQSASFMYTM